MPADGSPVPASNGADSAGKLRLQTLDSLDGRTSAAKKALRARDALIARTGQGGAQHGDVVHQLASRAIFLSLLLEDAEARALNGEPIEQAHYLSLVNAHRRSVEALGVLGSEAESLPKTPESAKPLAAAILGIIQDGGAELAEILGLDSDAPAEHAAAALETEGDALTPNSGCAAPSFSPPPEKPGAPNFSPAPDSADSEIFPNGSSVERVEITGSRQVKFAVIDARGHLHGYRRNRAKAVKLAENLPAPSFNPAPEQQEAS